MGLLLSLLLAANPAGEGELKVSLTPRGAPEWAAHVGGRVPLITDHQLAVDLESKATGDAATVGGRLAVITRRWLLSLSLCADQAGQLKPQAAARFLLERSALGVLELSAKLSPGDTEFYALAATLRPARSVFVIQLQSSPSLTSVSLSVRP